MARKAVRCEILIPGKVRKRCRCFIGIDNGRCCDRYGRTVDICDNHKKVIQRGRTVTDYGGCIWKLGEDGYLIQVNQTPAVTSEDPA